MHSGANDGQSNCVFLTSVEQFTAESHSNSLMCFSDPCGERCVGQLHVDTGFLCFVQGDRWSGGTWNLWMTAVPTEPQLALYNRCLKVRCGELLYYIICNVVISAHLPENIKWCVFSVA